MTTHRWALVLLVAGIVSGCGGGGGAQNHAPTASAGPAQTVNKGSTVTLDASASGFGPLTHLTLLGPILVVSPRIRSRR